MKRPLTALVLAGSLALGTKAKPTPAHAQWRGWGWSVGGFALGLFVGAALSRPAYAYGYGYPAYGYSYGYPAYAYGNGYPSYGYRAYYRPYYRSASYYGDYRPYYRPAFYGGYRVARRVAIHRARWR